MEFLFTPIKTERIDYRTETRSLETFLLSHISRKIGEKNIIFLSSKIVSLFQKNVRRFLNNDEKESFAKSLGQGSWRRSNPSYPLMIVGEGSILGYGGIDDSNIGDEESVLPPANPFEVAYNVITYIKQKSLIQDIAIVITDSKSVALRKGSVGMGIAWAGCSPIFDYRGKEDLFGRTLLYTSQNVIDSLAATAVFLMGEGSESTPIVIMNGSDRVIFTNDRPDKDSLFVKPKDDIFCDAFNAKVWR